MSDLETINDLVEKTVLLIFYLGPLTDYDQKTKDTDQWINELTVQDAGLMLTWVERHNFDSSMFQVSPEWDATTCRTILECIGLVAGRESAVDLRLRLESLLANENLRQCALYALSKVASAESLPAIRNILNDERYATVYELGCYLAQVKTVEASKLLDELLEKYKHLPFYYSTLLGWKRESELCEGSDMVSPPS